MSAAPSKTIPAIVAEWAKLYSAKNTQAKELTDLDDAELAGVDPRLTPAVRGVLVVNGALAGGRISDPSARDVDTITVRETVKAVRESEDWIPALIPAGAGLLAAVKR